jgi:hypothetical protein
MLPGYGSDGNTGDLAGRYQLSFELGCVGTVDASGRILGKVGVFEHGVHDGLRAHDLARCESSIQPKSGSYPAAMSWSGGSQGGSGRVIFATT